MRRTLIIGLVVGSLFGAGAMAVAAGEEHPHVAAGKAHALQSHHHVDSFTESHDGAGAALHPAPASWRRARHDSGPRREIVQVKHAVLSMLDLELRAGAMPRRVAQRKATSPERRRRAVKTLHASGRLRCVANTRPTCSTRSTQS